jgi:glycosyltransferase involved in cell wall biosynthesis
VGGEGLRVLYLIDSLVPSGAERSLAALAPAYADRGVELHVAYLQERAGLQEELRAAGAEAVSLAGPGGRLGWIGRARRAIRSRRPDLVHTTLAEADLAGRIAGRLSSVPVVSSLVNLQHAPEQFADPSVAPWKRRAARLADRITARSVVRFHAITEYIADTMSGILRIPRDRIDVVPRGRPAEGLGSRTPDRRAQARASLGLDDQAPLLVSVARQDRQKGLDVLLRALPAVAARFPRARLALVGRDGGMTPELHAIVDRLGLGEPVMFLGLRDDVPELLCAADVFVFPSRWEGLGSVLLEAMALEAPIVATDIPPIREAVAGDGAVASLVPVEDEAALAGAVVETLGDRAGSAERAAAGRRRFLERFTISPVADGMVAFYRRALAAYRGSVPA